jgi:hypothetical protein
MEMGAYDLMLDSILRKRTMLLQTIEDLDNFDKIVWYLLKFLELHGFGKVKNYEKEINLQSFTYITIYPTVTIRYMQLFLFLKTKRFLILKNKNTCNFFIIDETIDLILKYIQDFEILSGEKWKRFYFLYVEACDELDYEFEKNFCHCPNPKIQLLMEQNYNLQISLFNIYNKMLKKKNIMILWSNTIKVFLDYMETTMMPKNKKEYTITKTYLATLLEK